MSWICPNCGKTFKHTNQWHSCASVDIDEHFARKPLHIREMFDLILHAINEWGAFELNPVKTSIQIKTSATFLSIRPKRDRLEFEFFLGREVNEFPVYKTIRVSQQRVLHYAVAATPEEIDECVIGWVRESYMLVTR